MTVPEGWESVRIGKLASEVKEKKPTNSVSVVCQFLAPNDDGIVKS